MDSVFSVEGMYGYHRAMVNGTISVRVGEILVHGNSTKMGYCTCTASVSSQDTLSRVEDHWCWVKNRILLEEAWFPGSPLRECWQTSTYGKECLQPMKSNCCPGLAKTRGLETCTNGRTFYMAWKATPWLLFHLPVSPDSSELLRMLALRERQCMAGYSRKIKEVAL